MANRSFAKPDAAWLASVIPSEPNKSESPWAQRDSFRAFVDHPPQLSHELVDGKPTERSSSDWSWLKDAATKTAKNAAVGCVASTGSTLGVSLVFGAGAASAVPLSAVCLGGAIANTITGCASSTP